MEHYLHHERGRYKPVQVEEPLPLDNWPYNGHPQTPFDPQFGTKNPKFEKHIYIRRDQFMYDIDAQIQIVAMSRRDKNGIEDDRLTGATKNFAELFYRWIDHHVGEAKSKMATKVLEKAKDANINSISDVQEIDIELLMPEWWDATVFDQLNNAVHDYIVNAVLNEFFTIYLSPNDPVTAAKDKLAQKALANIVKYSEFSKPGRIRKPLKPFG